MMSRMRLPYRYQKTLDAIIKWCEENNITKFTGQDVGAPKGHLRGLANRGRIKRARDDKIGGNRKKGHSWELVIGVATND